MTSHPSHPLDAPLRLGLRVYLSVRTMGVFLVGYCFLFVHQVRDVLVQGRSFVDELSPQNFLSQNRAPCEDDFETIKLISNGAYG